MRGVAPQNAQSLYDTLPETVAQLLGATNHISAIADNEALGDNVPGVMAYFSPYTREVVVQTALTRSLNDVIEQPAGMLVQLQYQAQDEWRLKIAKTNLCLLLGRVVQGIGPVDRAVAENEWHSLWVHPHVHTLVFGIAELVAEQFINHVIVECGLDVVDPRLLEVELLHRRYVAQTELVAGILTEIARGRGTTMQDELCILLRDGCGQLALWRLVERWGAHADFANPKKLRGPGGLVELRHSLEHSLNSMTKEWLNAA